MDSDDTLSPLSATMELLKKYEEPPSPGYITVSRGPNRGEKPGRSSPNTWKYAKAASSADVYNQAETFFSRGDYEQALQWYKRGRRMRPRAREFQHGISKCERMMSLSSAENGLSPSFNFTSLTSTGSTPQSIGSSPSLADMSRTANKTVAANGTAPRGFVRGPITIVELPLAQTPPWMKDTTRTNELQKDVDSTTHNGKPLIARPPLPKPKKHDVLVNNLLKTPASNGKAVNMLLNDDILNIPQNADTRTKFWKQQLPSHLMRTIEQTYDMQLAGITKEEFSLPRLNSKDNMKRRTGTSSSIQQFMVREVNQIYQEFLEGRFLGSIARAERCLYTLSTGVPSDLLKKPDLICKVYGLKGHSYFQLDNYKEAMKAYRKELEYATELDRLDCKGMALENIGRVLARTGNFDNAIEIYRERLKKCKTEKEKSWLYHEIGYCCLSKQDYGSAKHYGELAYEAADNSADLHWQLNCSLLIAQTEGLFHDLINAMNTFKYAADIARVLGENETLQDIQESIDYIQTSLGEWGMSRNSHTTPSARNPLLRTALIKGRKSASALSMSRTSQLNENDLTLESLETDSQDNGGIAKREANKKLKRIIPQQKQKVKAQLLAQEISVIQMEKTTIDPQKHSHKPRKVTHSPLVLQGSGVFLNDRIGYMIKQSSSEDDQTISDDDPAPHEPSIKGILKNTMTFIYTDIDDMIDSRYLLPAIAHSNVHYSHQQADAGGLRLNSAAKKSTKSVRFSEDTTAANVDQKAVAVTEADTKSPPVGVLEAEGYFLGKYS